MVIGLDTCAPVEQGYVRGYMLRTCVCSVSEFVVAPMVCVYVCVCVCVCACVSVSIIMKVHLGLCGWMVGCI